MFTLNTNSLALAFIKFNYSLVLIRVKSSWKWLILYDKYSQILDFNEIKINFSGENTGASIRG